MYVEFQIMHVHEYLREIIAARSMLNLLTPCHLACPAILHLPLHLRLREPDQGSVLQVRFGQQRPCGPAQVSSARAPAATELDSDLTEFVALPRMILALPITCLMNEGSFLVSVPSP